MNLYTVSFLIVFVTSILGAVYFFNAPKKKSRRIR